MGVLKYDFVTNFLLSLTVKKFGRSVNIWRSYGQEYSVLFLTHSVLRLVITVVQFSYVFVSLVYLRTYRHLSHTQF